MAFRFPVSSAFLLPVLGSILVLNLFQFHFSSEVLLYIGIYVLFFLIGIVMSFILSKGKYLRISYIGLDSKRLLLFVVAIFILHIGVNLDRFSELSSGYSRSAEASGFVSTILELTISVLALRYTETYWLTRKLHYLLPYLMVVFISVLAASRAVIILQTIFFIGSGIYANRSSLKLFKFMIISAAILLSLFIGIGFYRGSFTSSKELVEVLFAYMFGGLFAFESFYELNNCEWAFSVLNLMPGLSKLLNMFGFSLDVNNYKYTAVSFPFLTNIYTSFREIITAFGVYGSFVFAIFHGYISGRLDVARRNIRGYSGILAPIVFTGNLYFLFYPITMYVFIVVYILILPIVKLK